MEGLTMLDARKRTATARIRSARAQIETATDGGRWCTALEVNDSIPEVIHELREAGYRVQENYKGSKKAAVRWDTPEEQEANLPKSSVFSLAESGKLL